VNLAAIQAETRADETAGRLLGHLLLSLGAAEDAQHAVPVYRVAASMALWLGDVADARRVTDRGWALVRATEDWILAARVAATVAEVDATAAAADSGRGSLAAILAARARTTQVLREATALAEASGTRPSDGSRRDAEAYLATARAYQARIDGHDDPAAWDRLARRWTAQGNRYEEARARWRQAEASLEARPGRDGREPAREAIEAAAGIAAELDARPLLRAIEALARRARIPLSRSVRRRIDEAIEDAEPSTLLAATGIGGGPSGRADAAADAPGSDAPATASAVLVVPAPPTGRTADAFGLSRRERDVLALIAEGHTNREIGQRLFISQKTVGVHVGNILAKLDVSGRVEAATVAIRLGLVDLGPA
jgi:DNA-binding CsgD family transcriptional regulator